jgi:integrase
MSIFKRGRVYWYHFVFFGEHVQESTKQGNPRVARVEPYARAKFEKPSPKTWLWYRFGLNTIYQHSHLANRNLDEITTEHIVDYAAYLQGKDWEIASVNSALRAVRRVLNLAVEWGVIEKTPAVTLLRGEHHREYILSPQDEARYLSAASEPLASVATVLVDTGLRPEECFKLRWEHVNFANGRQGRLRVIHGKTAAARRTLPLTTRVRNLLEARWENASRPEEGWVWPAPTKTGHLEHDSIRCQHKKAISASRVTPFVVYSFRHTFLTRLGESGCDPWTLARIAGHSSTKMSERYVHPSNDAMRSAMSRMPQPELLATDPGSSSQ